MVQIFREVKDDWNTSFFTTLNICFNLDITDCLGCKEIAGLLYSPQGPWGPHSLSKLAIGMSFAFGTWGCEFESRQVQCSHENWVYLKFSRSRSWLQWLIIVWIGYSTPLWLQQSLIKWFLMVWFTLGHSGQGTSVKCAVATWNNKARDVVHLKSPAFFFSFVLFCFVFLFFVYALGYEYGQALSSPKIEAYWLSWL